MRLCCYFLPIVFLGVLTDSVGARTWINAKGKSIVADFVKVENEVVHLKKGGKIYKVPIKSLSEEDQKFLAKQSNEKEEPALEEEPRVKLPINLKTKVSGDDLSLDTIKGKPIVIHQWQAHCQRCPKSLTAFEKLARRKKKSGAAFMVWHSVDKVTMAKNKSEKLGLKLPIYHGRMIRWDDKFGTFVWPHVILISAEGEVIYMGRPERDFEKALKEVSK